METIDDCSIPENQTSDFLTASQLVSLRKPDDDPARCVVGEKYHTRSYTWLENRAVECALESFKDTLNQKNAARICDLMQAEWNEELNASITSKLKGKFVQHMGHASNGKVALSPEESLFLLENGCIEILNGKTPMSTEEAYKNLLKGKLSAEKYLVYSQLSQLGFIVVQHQTELNITKYEKRLNLDKYQTKRKRKSVSGVCGEPENKRLTFTGAFSNKAVLPVNSAMEAMSSASVAANSISEFPGTAPEIVCDASAHGNVGDEVKESDAIEMSAEQSKEVENFSNNVTDSETIVDGIEEFKEASSVKALVSNHVFNGETDEQAIFTDTVNDTSDTGNRLENNSKGIEVELETVEVGLDEEVSGQQDADTQSCLDTNFDPVPTNNESNTPLDYSKNSIDIMNIDSQNTEISCTSEASRNENNTSNSNIDETEDSSTSVMDELGDAPNGDSNSDLMSYSSDTDDVLSVGVHSTLSEDIQEDDEIKLLEVTKKETKPLAVIDLLSEEDGDEESELSGSDDDIQVVKVCNSSLSGSRSHPLKSSFKTFYPCKKEEKGLPASSPNRRANFLKLRFPNCSRKNLTFVSRPPSEYLPPNVCPSKEAYAISVRPQHRLWNSYRVMQDYQRARRQNRYTDQPFPFYRSHESNHRADGFTSRDGRQHFNSRWGGPSESNEFHPWADNSSHRDSRQNVHHRRTDLSRMQSWLDPPACANQNLNHRTDSPEVYSNFQNSEQNSWLSRNAVGPLRQESPSFRHGRSMDSTLPFPNSHSFSPFNSPSLQNSYRYPIPNAAAAINSVVSVSNQDMNVSMVGNHILHPPLHSSSPHLPSFNANLPNLSAIGPVDIMAEVQRTAYTVATNMLSSMFGQNMNPHAMPHLPPFNAFQPAQSNPYGFPTQFNSVFNSQNYSSEHYSTAVPNRQPFREPFRGQYRSDPFPCQYRNLRNRSSWNEVKVAVGDQDSSVDNESDVEEVRRSPSHVLCDPKNICPLVRPGHKYTASEVLQQLKVTQMANLLSDSCNDACSQGTCSIEISFDVYLPGTNYKKTSPDIPKHRIVVVRSTDPIPRYSDIVFLQKKWNDGAMLQVAVVDNGDVSYSSFNSICLPTIVPHQN